MSKGVIIMKKMNLLIGLALIVTSGYLYVSDGPEILSFLLLVGGVASIALDLIFSPAEPFDERQKEIKSKSGHISYLFSILYMFLLLVLIQYGIIANPLIAIFILLAGHVLTFPIVSLVYTRRM